MRPGGVALLLAAGTGCSFVGFHPKKCTENAECHEAFGPGTTCDDAGACGTADPLAGCDDIAPYDLLSRPDWPGAIVLGAVLDAASDAPEANAVRLAAVQAQAAGGVGGRAIGLVTCDLTRGDATEMAAWLESDVGAAVIVGPMSAEGVLAVAEGAPDALVVTPGATAGDLASPLLRRTVGTGDQLAQALAAEVTGEVAVLYEAGLDREDVALSLATALGTTAVRFATDAERDAAVSALGSPDAIALVAGPLHAVSLVNALAVRPALAETRLVLGDEAADPLLIELTGASSSAWPRVRGIRWAPSDGAAWDAFAASYAAAHPGRDANEGRRTAQAWDAAWLGLYGAAWGVLQDGAVSGAAAAEGLDHVSAGSPAEIQAWGPVVERLRAGAGVDLAGASGALDYAGGELAPPLAVWRIEDGEIRDEE